MSCFFILITKNYYENALAESVNRILKQEYYLDFVFVDKSQAKKAVKLFIYTIIAAHAGLKGIDYSDGKKT